MINMDKMEKIFAINVHEKIDRSDETRLTEEMDILIYDMLYDDIVNILIHEYGKNGEYDAKTLREKVNSTLTRDLIRKWIKSKNRNWIINDRKDRIKSNCRIWAMRHETEYLSRLQNNLLNGYISIMFHYVLYNCSYTSGSSHSYKRHMKSEIMKYKLMS